MAYRFFVPNRYNSPPMPPTESTIGARIRAMRLERGLRSAEALALRMSELGYATSRKQVADWERNAYEPGVLHRIGLSAALRVGQDYLLFGEDEEAGGESEFIARLRGLESSLRPRDRRSILALVESMVRENEEEEELARRDASVGMTEEQRRIAEEGMGA